MADEIYAYDDAELLAEIQRRFAEKTASIKEMEFLTKKLMELNERSKQADSVKDHFLSLIKNEINNPLCSLLNIATILVNKTYSGQFDDTIALLHKELLVLDFDMRNIFAATEIEDGKFDPHYSHISFADIYNDVIGSFRYLIKEKQLTVALARCDDKEFVCDAHKLFLILLNLVSNACEFSFPESKVAVSLKKTDDCFQIIVADSGEGIGVDYSNQVFQRFARPYEGKLRSRVGLGLGLSVVRGLCEQMNGTVSFVSGEGDTTFTVSLPIIDISLSESDCMGADEFIFDSFGSDSKEM
ncbi:hypothetical protein FACS1894103_1050 [Campylobacterota bacterium]|nr:hypothetical protein FACS1894103_1050 [Campylobacterota bacterium]